MPKSKKHPKDMTTEELGKAVFPKEVQKRLKEIAHEKDKKTDAKSSSQRQYITNMNPCQVYNRPMMICDKSGDCPAETESMEEVR